MTRHHKLTFEDVILEKSQQLPLGYEDTKLENYYRNTKHTYRNSFINLQKCTS